MMSSISPGRSRLTDAASPSRLTVAKKQVHAVEFDMPAGTGRSDSLHHRFAGAYGFDGRVGDEAAGESLIFAVTASRLCDVWWRY